MMSWKSLGRLFSGIRGAYNDINPSTLTGAVDVIVVEQPDGTFTCGRFYVRFGKLTAISPADKIVELYVNGRYIDFLRMKLGAAGDAYFVDSDACSSDDEKYPEIRDVNVKWPETVVRRRRRKVRRDSAVSESDATSFLDELNDGPSLQSDSECTSEMVERLCSIGFELEKKYGDLIQNHSEYESPCFTEEVSVPVATESAKQDCSNTKLDTSKNVEIYLEDLVTSEVDPTVKDTYIYPPTHTNCNSGYRSDAYGRSFFVDMQCVDAGYKSDGEHSPRSSSPIYPTIYDLKLSLCGCPSADSPVSNEKFVQHLVSYEEFIQDPESVLANPNLTVQLNGKYLSWPLAAPSIVSILAFQTELPHRTIRHLEDVHMSKKASRRTSWFSWGSRRVVPEEHGESKTTETVPLPEVVEEMATVLDVVEPVIEESKMMVNETVETLPTSRRYSLSSNDISRLNLKRGRNDVEFRLITKYQGTCICSASIYLWHWTDRIVISDVDGTITRSDLLGHLLPMVGHDWTHYGVAPLYDHIAKNGYRFLYLSARAIGQAGITRSYLHHVVQENFKLPDGPILLFPNSLLHALHQEVIEKKPENFKIKCLSDVTALFPKDSHPLYAGFGNKSNDVFAYEKAGIERCRIFTVNTRGELRNEYHSIKCTSYKELNDSVDLHFPLIADGSREQIPVVDDDCSNEKSPSLIDNKDRIFRRFSVGAPSADMSMYSCFTYWKDPFDASLFPEPDEPS